MKNYSIIGEFVGIGNKKKQGIYQREWSIFKKINDGDTLILILMLRREEKKPITNI